MLYDGVSQQFFVSMIDMQNETQICFVWRLKVYSFFDMEQSTEDWVSPVILPNNWQACP